MGGMAGDALPRLIFECKAKKTRWSQPIPSFLLLCGYSSHSCARVQATKWLGLTSCKVGFPFLHWSQT